MAKKVFVSGCYDMLHSGHVAFFEEAAKYGDLYVGVGSDRTIADLKARKPVNMAAERLYMVQSLKAVTDAWINSGSGILDFEEDIRQFRPDIFYVNEDGHSAQKEALCRALGIEYVIGQRIPHTGLPVRSTTLLRQECRIPYRLDLAGGWLDQPFVSQYCDGAVLTLCIEPDIEFNDRSGMATSARKKAIELWQTDLPPGDPEQIARLVFSLENAPGQTEYVSGSQDAIGITFPGLNKLFYRGEYWPAAIESVSDDTIFDWLEAHIRLVQMFPRRPGYDALGNRQITPERAEALSRAAEKCWQAILAKDLPAFGEAVRESFEAQISMFPNTCPDEVRGQIDSYKDEVLGYKITGAGGGGYLVLITDHEIANTLKIRVRRP
ncbi:MAG: adenylyltransferase/cytidyltransferase family protein [Rikenellaceae bacterium]|nr:adenylyltransferase/cytidyltransferase family protein [Rikenellaceae bacterium]